MLTLFDHLVRTYARALHEGEDECHSPYIWRFQGEFGKVLLVLIRGIKYQ